MQNTLILPAQSADPHIDTLGIILRSTATLAIDCKKFDTALEILNEFLPFDFPEALKDELDELKRDLQYSLAQIEQVVVTDKVFIIEESAPMRYLLKEIFEGKFNFVLFDSVHQIEDHIKTEGFPQLIILGIDCIESDNFQLNELVKLANENFLSNKTRTILLSSRESYQSNLPIYRNLFDLTITKPFNPLSLIETVERILPIGSPQKKNKDFLVKDFSTRHIPDGKPSVGKRLFDIIFSSLAIFFLSPLFILIAIAIKIESKGPAFYFSKRAGRGLKIFNFYKFRTMAAHVDKRLQKATSLTKDGSSEGPVFFKADNDPRITRVGSFLRNTSLDELPQLINVLLGDMSLVGNRPLPLYEAATMTTDHAARRFLAPAGITGLWQIKKKGNNNNITMEERIELDINYAEKSSFIYDLWIIAHTPGALLQKENL